MKKEEEREMSKAYNELQRIRKSAAFTVKSEGRKVLNQYAIEYSFDDGTVLKLYPKSRRGQSFTQSGLCDCASAIFAY